MVKLIAWTVVSLLISNASDAKAPVVCTRIGLLGEFKRPTGSFSQPFGNEIRDGFELAKSRLAEQSSECVEGELIDIDNSIANIDELIRQASKRGIHYFIGLGTSDQSLAARRALVDTGSILITPTASSMAVQESPTRTIMLFPTNEIIAKELIKVAKAKGAKKIVSIYAANNSYSSDMNRVFMLAAHSAGLEVTSEPIRSGHIELSGAVNTLRATGAKFVFLPLFELDAAKVIAEIGRSKLSPLYIGTDAWGTYSTVLKSLVRGTQERAVLPVIYDPALKSGPNSWFVQSFEENFSRLPTDLAAFSFDAVAIVAKLSKNCGTKIETNQISKCLSKILPFSSTTGPIRAKSGLSLQRKVAVREVVLGQADASKKK